MGSPGFATPGCGTCHIMSPPWVSVHNYKMDSLGLVTLKILLALRIYGQHIVGRIKEEHLVAGGKRSSALSVRDSFICEQILSLPHRDGQRWPAHAWPSGTFYPTCTVAEVNFVSYLNTFGLSQHSPALRTPTSVSWGHLPNKGLIRHPRGACQPQI